MKNKMTDLRDHLFETLEALKDDEKPMEIARAKAIADVAGKLIDSAKVEVDFIRAVGAKSGSQFLESAGKPAIEPPKPRAVGNS